MTLSRTAQLRLRARQTVRHRLGVPRVARYSLGWDILAGASAGCFMGMTMPFLTRIARADLHASDAALTLMNAAPFVGNLLAPVWARQMEGRAKMPFCIGSWSAGRGILLLMPLAFTAWGFVGLVSAMLFVMTIGSPAYASLMKDIYPDRARGRLMGYVRVAIQLMMFLATLITGRLIDHGVSYRVLFPVAGCLGIGTAVFFSRVRPWAPPTEPVRSETNESAFAFLWSTLTILRDNVPYRWFALAVMTYGFGNLMASPLYALFQVERLHIRATEIANLTNLTSLCSIGGSFFWGRFLDRHGAPATVYRGILIMSGISVIYLFAHSVTTLYLAAILAGFSVAGIELSYMASILLYANEGKAARYQALHSFLLGVRGVLAPLVAIPLARVMGFQFVFVLTLICMLVGAWMQWNAARLRPR